MNQEKIGKFIAQKRKEKDLTQEELANKLGITKNAVSKWERGISLMDISLLKEVSQILDISITELLAGEDLKDNSKTDEIIDNSLKTYQKKEKTKKFKLLFIVILISFVILGCIFKMYYDYKKELIIKYTPNENNILNYKEKEITINKKETNNILNLGKINIEKFDDLNKLEDNFYVNKDNNKAFFLGDDNNNLERMLYSLSYDVNHPCQNILIDNLDEYKNNDIFELDYNNLNKILSSKDNENNIFTTENNMLKNWCIKRIKSRFASDNFKELIKLNGDIKGYIIERETYFEVKIYNNNNVYQLFYESFNLDEVINSISSITFN